MTQPKLNRSPKRRFDKKSLASEWFAKTKEDDKESFRDQLVRNTLIWDRFREIVERMFEKADAEYDPEGHNYAVRCSFDAGYRKALREIYDLIPPDQK